MTFCDLEPLFYIKLKFLQSLSSRLPPIAIKVWFWCISDMAFFLEKDIISSCKSLFFSPSFILSSWWTLLRCSNLPAFSFFHYGLFLLYSLHKHMFHFFFLPLAFSIKFVSFGFVGLLKMEWLILWAHISKAHFLPFAMHVEFTVPGGGLFSQILHDCTNEHFPERYRVTVVFIFHLDNTPRVLGSFGHLISNFYLIHTSDNSRRQVSIHLSVDFSNSFLICWELVYLDATADQFTCELALTLP